MNGWETLTGRQRVKSDFCFFKTQPGMKLLQRLLPELEQQFLQLKTRMEKSEPCEF